MKGSFYKKNENINIPSYIAWTSSEKCKERKILISMNDDNIGKPPTYLHQLLTWLALTFTRILGRFALIFFFNL